MATVTALIQLADDMYPNAISTANKVDYMNMAQDELARKLGIIIEDTSLVTVADQDAYDYPSGIEDISDIISLAVASSTSPSDRYDYTKYYVSRSEQNPATDRSFFQIVDEDGAKQLVLYPTPSTSGYTIIIRYRKRLARLSASALTAEPEFDERYHHILALFCAHMICSVGASPDAYQADMFMQKYQSALDELWDDTTRERVKSKKTRKDNPQWHRYSSYGKGG